MSNKLSVALPAGTILAFAAPTTKVPPGFLPCDGSAVSVFDYPDLFANIGEMFNRGDEATDMFRLPDMTGRLPLHVNPADPVINQVGPCGQDTVTLTSAHLPVHTHALIETPHTHTATASHSHTISHNPADTRHRHYFDFGHDKRDNNPGGTTIFNNIAVGGNRYTVIDSATCPNTSAKYRAMSGTSHANPTAPTCTVAENSGAVSSVDVSITQSALAVTYIIKC
jgi:microcystin-dependent protein